MFLEDSRLVFLDNFTLSCYELSVPVQTLDSSIKHLDPSPPVSISLLCSTPYIEYTDKAFTYNFSLQVWCKVESGTPLDEPQYSPTLNSFLLTPTMLEYSDEALFSLATSHMESLLSSSPNDLYLICKYTQMLCDSKNSLKLLDLRQELPPHALPLFLRILSQHKLSSLIQSSP